jgi:hypothetical protein
MNNRTTGFKTLQFGDSKVRFCQISLTVVSRNEHSVEPSIARITRLRGLLSKINNEITQKHCRMKETASRMQNSCRTPSPAVLFRIIPIRYTAVSSRIQNSESTIHHRLLVSVIPNPRSIGVRDLSFWQPSAEIPLPTASGRDDNPKSKIHNPKFLQPLPIRENSCLSRPRRDQDSWATLFSSPGICHPESPIHRGEGSLFLAILGRDPSPDHVGTG